MAADFFVVPTVTYRLLFVLVLVFNESGLRRVLQAYRRDCERSRTHLALAKDTPIPRPIMGDGVVVAIPEIGRLHHRYERRAT